MLSKFPGYYRPSENAFRDLWRQSIFVFDTNVLLNLYRYSPATRDALCGLLESLKDRCWLPNQVGAEFLRRRIGIIIEQVNAYEKMRITIQEHVGSVESVLKRTKGHPFLPDEALSQYQDSVKTLIAELERRKVEIEEYLENDGVLVLLGGVFEGRTGDGYDDNKTQELTKEWNARKEKLLPPGFKDEAPGDMIIWEQILDEAKRQGRPVILVTDDRKEDWWYIVSGRTQGPRPELIEEFLSKAAQSFYMYTPPRFLEFANSYLSQSVPQETIDEADSLNQADLQQQLAEQALLSSLLLNRTGQMPQFSGETAHGLASGPGLIPSPSDEQPSLDNTVSSAWVPTLGLAHHRGLLEALTLPPTFRPDPEQLRALTELVKVPPMPRLDPEQLRALMESIKLPPMPQLDPERLRALRESLTRTYMQKRPAPPATPAQNQVSEPDSRRNHNTLGSSVGPVEPAQPEPPESTSDSRSNDPIAEPGSD